MPWHSLPSLKRGDQLTASYLSRLRENIRYLQAGFEAEHLASGAHNAYQIPKVVATIVDTTVYGDSAGYISSVTRSGAVRTFRLPSSVFPVANGKLTESTVAVRVCPWSEFKSAQWRPVSAFASYGYHDADYTSVSIDLRVLSSALGAGNNWTDAAATTPVSVAIHAIGSPTRLTRYFKLPRAGSVTTDAADSINGLVREIEDLHDALRVGHSAAGVHAGESEFFPRSALIDYAGGFYAYVKEWGATLGSASAPAVGRIYLANAGAPTARARFVGDWAGAAYPMSSAERTVRLWNNFDDGASARGAQCFYFDGTNWGAGRASGTAHGKILIAEHEL